MHYVVHTARKSFRIQKSLCRCAVVTYTRVSLKCLLRHASFAPVLIKRAYATTHRLTVERTDLMSHDVSQQLGPNVSGPNVASTVE